VLLPIVHEAGALFLVNDRLDVALAIGADGVHVGPEDLSVDAVRRAVSGAPGARLGASFILGASTDDPERARSLAEAGADYIGCGTVYATTTKADAGPVIGIEGLERVAEAVDVPVVGVGGIDAGRSAEIASRTRASGVAVVGAVMRAKDVGDVVRRLMAPWAR
jgi:thiamine-phosphate diphosphorylase